MIRYNANRVVVICAIIFLLIFIFVNQNGEPKTDTTPQISKSETAYVQATTLADLPKTINETRQKKTRREKVAEKFFVFSPKCKIPYVDPFTYEILDPSEQVPHLTCGGDPDLFSVLYDRKKRHYILHLNEEISDPLYSNITELYCVYRQTVPGTDDTFAMTYASKPLTENFIVPRDFLGLVVQCYDVNNLSRVVHADAFSFAQYPDHRNETNDDWRGAHYPSVFLFGIDSMSRMNFRRTMPLTSEFTRQQGWYEMEGYNKVGDNTLPNLLAVLTGRSTSEWSRKCNLKSPGCFDFITYLWDYFRSAGYMTAYAEDLPSISTFNYLKAGFRKKPVDFYLRPFLVIIESVLKTVVWLDQKYCVGRRTSFSYVFDYAKQLIQRFVKETPKPLFGLFWTSSCTHDHPKGGELLDERFVNYLEQFKNYGLFDKAIVILFSDHGLRFGELTEHPSGFLEERLPMLHIYLPPWYRRRFPQVARALQLNRNRLTSGFDLHMGIITILEQIRPRINYSIWSCEGCRSIFEVVPSDRGCDDAKIPYHSCACNSYVPVPISDIVQRLATAVVQRMNEFLTQLDLNFECGKLYLRKVLSAKLPVHLDGVGMGIYQLEFITSPNGGKFRSFVRMDDTSKLIEIELEGISRLNSYRNESYCVKDAMAKKICACRDKNWQGSLIDDQNTKIEKTSDGVVVYNVND
ncbi:uncharacterized protein LOC121404052 [Drosophila obscura]|uniref:uncharacterized protein LOC121404052 n=1 Tax=Drosophila obscura TaxID=7282 RepID=UPI001BB138B7|nr:uncharacterized protein LOC121404052 [Drosophila obscura]